MSLDSRIYFIRHAESQANATGILAGGQDSPLTELGLQQARDEAYRIRDLGIRFDTIISSPQSRARDTAKIIAKANGYPVERIAIVDGLRERSGGAYEGRPIEHYSAASSADLLDAKVESFESFAARVKATNQVLSQQAEGTTLVVGHSGFYRMAQAIKDGLEPDGMLDVPSPANSTLLSHPI